MTHLRRITYRAIAPSGSRDSVSKSVLYAGIVMGCFALLASWGGCFFLSLVLFSGGINK